MSDYIFMNDNKIIPIDKCLAIFHIRPTATPISAVIHFEASSDEGLTWDSLLVRPINSGIPQEYIMIPGVFYADIQHATHIRYVKDLSHSNSFTVKTKFVANLTLQNETIRSTKRYSPFPARLNPIIRPTLGREISDVTPEGTIYAYGGTNLYKSTNLGVSWVQIQNPFTQGNISRFKKLTSKELLIVGNDLDGKKGLQVWKSNTDEEIIRKVAVLDTVSDANSFWGLETYGNIILFAPYVLQPRKSKQTLKAYISRDYGETWKCIFNAPSIESWHFHSIKLDPYESRIWLLNGDGTKNTNVWFTDDWGQNWSNLWPEGKSPVQFTDLAILPHCLIFGMDDNKGRGFFRLDKAKNRSSAGDLKSQLHEAFFIDKIGAPAEATGTLITHLNVAYLPSQSPRGLLTATKDGIDFYVLWDYTQQPTGPVEGLSYFAATNTGKLIGYFKDDSLESNPFIWIADQPNWIEN